MSKVFTEDESRVLDKIVNTGEQVIDSMIKDGIPESTKTIRVLTEVMNSVSSVINSRVSNRLKDKEVETNAQLGKQMAIEALKLASQAKETAAVANTQPEFRENLDKSKIVDGQTSQGVQQFDPTVIVNVVE